MPLANILIIDDDANAREALAQFLVEEGYDVSVATDGEAALQSVESSAPDLVITDLEMPHVSGFGFIDAFRQRFGDIPVIVVSGHDATAYRVAGLELGADDFLSKPVDLDELLARIHVRLHHAKREREAVREGQSDALTGMLNRRGITSFWERALASPPDAPAAISVAVIDVDDFKAINDRYGHVVGDSALCAVANALQNTVRTTDRVGRIGGDEFLVVCPGADALQIDEIVRRMRAQQPIALAVPGCGTIPIRYSIGWATRHGGEEFTTLMTRADDAMYRDKRA